MLTLIHLYHLLTIVTDVDCLFFVTIGDFSLEKKKQEDRRY